MNSQKWIVLTGFYCVVQGVPKSKPLSRISTKSYYKPPVRIHFLSIIIFCIKYSMSDVISCYVWSCDTGKNRIRHSQVVRFKAAFDLKALIDTATVKGHGADRVIRRQLQKHPATLSEKRIGDFFVVSIYRSLFQLIFCCQVQIKLSRTSFESESFFCAAVCKCTAATLSGNPVSRK